MSIKPNLIPFALAALCISLSLAACKNNSPAANASGLSGEAEATSVKFNADSAYASVEKQCSFGPRTPNSEAHRQCGDYIAEKFRSYGLEVTEQKAVLTGWDGNKLNSRNIIASYAPEAKERVIVCAHWDSRPWCDADPDSANHRKPVMAANDGASGVAVMLEMARLAKELNPAVGIDFICFDAEDYGRPYWAPPSEDDNDWCLGSQYWAAHPHKEGYSALYGILLDMVGGRDARFHYEGFSLKYAQGIVGKVWAAAQTAGAAEYFPQAEGTYAQDDHLSLNEIAGIPTIDIIPYSETSEHVFGETWHTTHDTPQNISRETLRAVGQTLLQVLSEEK